MMMMMMMLVTMMMIMMMTMMVFCSNTCWQLHIGRDNSTTQMETATAQHLPVFSSKENMHVAPPSMGPEAFLKCDGSLK